MLFLFTHGLTPESVGLFLKNYNYFKSLKKGWREKNLWIGDYMNTIHQVHKRKRGKKSKLKNNRYHFKRRFAQRFDVTITNYDIDQIVKMIMQHQSSWSKKISNSRTKHRLVYNGVDCVIVYDKKRRCPITVYEPPDKYK